MRSRTSRIALITGGAGFIGSNLAERLLGDPDVHVRIFDNLSRCGVQHNLDWLQALDASRRLTVVHGDVRDAAAVRDAVRNATEIYHLAAQVAVTTSVDDPASDFATNALGTFHVLEAARVSGRKPFFLFTSTNKVYGSLENTSVEVENLHYRACAPEFRGVDEAARLDFHSPYGCSKGAADQYVHDYARIYDLPTVVFRMSCIAGPRQFGNEDQGWVAHFVYSVLTGRPITIYGNGYQVRDVLHVHDLVDAMIAVRERVDRTRGHVFNLGGGMDRMISVLELLRAIEAKTGIPVHLQYSATRPGDQPLYISNTAKLRRHTGWQPSRSLDRILEDIHEFWRNHRQAIATNMASVHSSSPELVAQEVA